MKSKIFGLFKDNGQEQHMEKMPIDDLLKILNNAKTDGAKYVSIGKLDISYMSQPKKLEIPQQLDFKNNNLVESYKEFLIDNKIKPLKLTVARQYVSGLKKACQEEGCSLEQLIQNIDKLLPQYKTGGCKEKIGNVYAGAVKAALEKLKDFRDFRDLT